ncbi:thioredoxin reductase (NADPH) [Enhydrobacter aerosaccus]|uniref:Thioredoxin reductase n=1 Tax=Enhydrobacter aerosaccus TaxID=225324 RepID=A0A1T4LE67_9HYPH|nr:NAD(P)/FAD-dependent oxidoreductase [Enhydrobacter aerosaccus]SJZ52906.1 thioredoxin reductase (NADPH) [Enhydrobacter aerosaccus]
MSTPSYDLIVIGAGPAGLTAATEAARAGLKALCLDKLAPGGQLMNLGELHDFDEIWNGPDMAARLTDDATVAGVEIGFGEVNALASDGCWTVETAEGEKHTGRAIIVATGLNKGKLGLPNEADYEGRGLSHCAHCDGPLYAGLPVVVAGGDGWAKIEAKELVGLAGQVTVVDENGPESSGNITRITGRIAGLEGRDGLQAVTVDSKGARKTIPANAVFVYVGQSPAAEFLPDSLARDATGHIVVDAEGRTSAPAVFAIGDVRSGSRRYLADAIADGQRAAQAVVAALKKN